MGFPGGSQRRQWHPTPVLLCIKVQPKEFLNKREKTEIQKQFYAEAYKSLSDFTFRKRTQSPGRDYIHSNSYVCDLKILKSFVISLISLISWYSSTQTENLSIVLSFSLLKVNWLFIWNPIKAVCTRTSWGNLKTRALCSRHRQHHQSVFISWKMSCEKNLLLCSKPLGTKKLWVVF